MKKTKNRSLVDDATKMDMANFAAATNSPELVAAVLGLPATPLSPNARLFNFLDGLVQRMGDSAVLESLPVAKTLVEAKRALRERDWTTCEQLLKRCKLPRFELRSLQEILNRLASDDVFNKEVANANAKK